MKESVAAKLPTIQPSLCRKKNKLADFQEMSVDIYLQQFSVQIRVLNVNFQILIYVQKDK
jgi:hypothetical protein